MKLRVFELAEKVGRSPEEVRDLLVSRGKKVRSKLSLVDAPAAEQVLQHYKDLKNAPEGSGDGPHVVRATRGSTPSGVVKVKTPKRPKAPKTSRAEEEDAVSAEAKKPKAKQPKRPGQPGEKKSEAVAEAAAEVSVEEAPEKPKVILERIDIPPKPAAPPPQEQAPEVPEVPEAPKAPKVPKVPKGTKVSQAPPAPAPRPEPRYAPGFSPAGPAPAPAPAPPRNAGTSRPPMSPDKPKGGVSAIPQAARGQRAMGNFPGRGRPKRGKRKGKKSRAEAEKAPEIQEEILPLEGETRQIKVPEGVTVSELAEKMSVKSADIIKKLMLDHKMMATMNQKLDNEVAELLAADFNCELSYEGLYGEEQLEELEQDNPENLVPRAPVVTIMGHVDHGKTSLLDAIRESDVAAGESGGITQHIGAYKVKVAGHDSFPGGDVAFLDTPGHEAFTAMRARGAKATDVVVLVVAADDSVKPQTVEAINHAKDAEVPIVVAVNKIDKEGANPDRVMQDLANYGLTPEAWGGKTQMTNVSAKKREGITELLEILALETEILELKADPTRRAKGTIVEAKLDKGRGAVATVLVQTGTLKVGDIFVIGHHHGRVRALLDDHGKKVTEAGPSTPVEILGLSGVPEAGDPFQAVENEKLAREIASKRQAARKDRERAGGRVHLEDLFGQIEAGEVKELKLLIKADVTGSAEALKDSLEKIESEKIKAKVIHYGVGDITESDVNLAAASNAIILGFHVRAQGSAVELAHKEDVEVRLYKVIYEAVEEIRESMEGMLEPHFHEVESGKGMVKQVFKAGKHVIAGSLIENGKVVHDGGVKVTRNGEVVWEGKILSLKRFKEDAKEVTDGLECGIGLPGDVALQEDDRLEFTAMESVAQKL